MACAEGTTGESSLHFVASRDIAQPVVVHAENEEEAAMQRVVEQALLVLD